MTNKNKIIIGTPIKNRNFPIGVGFYNNKIKGLSPSPIPPPTTNYLLTNNGNVIVTNNNNEVIINA